MKAYGITIEEYERLSEDQGHVCAICKCAQVPSRVCKRLVVDHCHQSGKIRGLLCSLCNPMLGYARDNTEILKKGIEYLVVPQFSR
ncbi:MAG: endonuclease VII domain-containing protein [Bacteroidales bacterium]